MHHILVIEDEPCLRENITEILTIENFQVSCAANGQEGVAMAKEQAFDLIICDVMMPHLDGYGVLEQVRSLPGRINTSFVFLTAKANKPDIRQGMEQGADDYLTKPFTQQELLNTVRVLLEKRRQLKAYYEQRFDELRRNIASSLPHELLTPLCGMLGLSNYLQGAAGTIDPSELLEIVTLMHNSTTRFERVVQNSLLYAKLCVDSHTGKAQPSVSLMICDCSQFIIHDAAVGVAKRKGRMDDLRVECTDVCLILPQQNLQKIVEELVDNACKFSTEGTPIDVIGKLNNRWYELTITDRGRGMTSKQIAEIGAYVQFDRPIYEQQGSGLGLAIVRQLATLHNGHLEISCQSEGTCVRVMLPAKMQ